MGKKQHVKHGLTLTKDMVRKLAKHKNILLKKEHMEGGSIEVHIAPSKLRKIMTAIKKDKGLRFNLSNDELENTIEHGSGFKDLLKKGYEFVKKEGKPIVKDLVGKAEPIVAKTIAKSTEKYIGKDASDSLGKMVASSSKKFIDKTLDGSSFKQAGTGKKLSTKGDGLIDDIKKVSKKVKEGYKKHVKNTPVGSIIREGAKQAIKVGLPSLTSAILPEATPIVATLANKYGDKIVEKSGLGLGDGMFLPINHPAMNPKPEIQGIKNSVMYKGESFLQSGSSFMQAGRSLKRYSIMSPAPSLAGISDIPRTKSGSPIKDFIYPSTSF